MSKDIADIKPRGDVPTDADYEKAEMDLLKEALRRSDKERFLMMTTLMKMNLMFKRAKITFKPYTLEK